MLWLIWRLECDFQIATWIFIHTFVSDAEAMDVDAKSPGDVEMSANMERGLLSEFDKAGSRKSISFAC